ncbi:hypothetical protein ASE38_02135 [Cellulomonas sp. Root930]|nr:hypothetical protein ASE38_02135 [Cellulomonas sp. Root930]
MPKFLVTGAAGFIGSTLTAQLLADEANAVIGLDRLSDYYDVRIKRARLEALASSRFTFVESDLSVSNIATLLHGVAGVFHLAGQPGVRPSWGDSFLTYVSDNVVATQRLLEAIAAADAPPRLIYSSSSSIYGDAEKYPVSESDLPRPISPYGVTKLAGEHLCSLYASKRGIETVSLRYFTVFGAGQRPDMAFTRLMVKMLSGEEFFVNGDGSQIRDFTHVTDIVSANLAAYYTAGASGRVFNVSGGSSVSLLEAIRITEELAGVDARLTHLPGALGDVARTGGASDDALDVLSWKPRVDLPTGLTEQLAWVAANLPELRRAINN